MTPPFDFRSQRFAVIAVLAFAAVSVGLLHASAGETVAVQLKDGRVLTGEVHSRTDDSELWLRLTGPSIVVMSSAPWSEVVSARVAGGGPTIESFRKSAEQMKTPIPGGIFQQRNAVPPAPLPPPAHIRSLDMLVSLTNWDRDAEVDGLKVRLSPLAEDGRLVAADGLATIRLLGRRLGTRDRLESQARFGFWTNGSNNSEYYEGRGDDRYVELGRWTERIRANQFTEHGYVVRLPFRNVHPDYDLDVALDGLVDASFSVSGQNIHRATASVELRVFSLLRDELQLNRRTRFFPDELRRN